MSIDIFLQQFDQLAQSNGGVKKLRGMILQLAMQGKLVEQNPADEPAEVLLKKIEAEKKRLVKDGEIKKQRGNSISQHQDVPYTLPRNWKWVELTEVTTMITDGSHNPPPKQPVGIPMLSGQNIKKGLINFEASRLITEEDYIQEIRRTPIQQGDVFLSIVGTIGESAVVPDGFPRVALQRSIALIRTLINPFFLSKVFSSPMAFSYYDKHAKGTAQKGIYLGKLSEFLVPLPPLAEQKRIVAKVDELMTLCDQLEAHITHTQTLNTHLMNSLIHRMTEAA